MARVREDSVTHKNPMGKDENGVPESNGLDETAEPREKECCEERCREDKKEE